MTSTLKLHPTNMSEVIMYTYAGLADNGYYVPTQSLQFNESGREEILYSEIKTGGFAIDKVSKLTPLTFEVIVIGSSRDDLLDKVKSFKQYITVGGYLEWQPDGASRSTWYRYEPSNIPALNSNGLWDKAFAEGGLFALGFTVELMTHPAAISNPDDLITLGTETITNNGDYIDLTNIKGDLPAHLITSFTNNNAADLTSLYCSTRTSKYSNFTNLVQRYETFTVGAGWSTIGDVPRNDYYRLTATSTDAYTLECPISNEVDHRGRIIVMMIGKPDGAWTAKIGLKVGSQTVWTANSYQPITGTDWNTFYIGEFDNPPMVIPKGEALDLSLVVYLKPPTASSIIDVDALFFMFTEDSLMEIKTTLPQSSIAEVGDNNARRYGVIRTGGSIAGIIAQIYGSQFLTAENDTRMFIDFVTSYTSPEDTVDVTVKALFRTIYPFGSY